MSMLTNSDITLTMYFCGPNVAHVTLVKAPAGISVDSAVLWASNGFRKSSLIVTLDPGDVPVISMRPSPALLLPAHSYTAPLPLGAPARVFFIAGSNFSQGDQESHRWKS